jgi:hypothetical protein
VDLQNYMHHAKGRNDPITVPDRPSTGRVAIARRPGIELPLQVAAAGGGADAAVDAGESVEAPSPLDVPAFLRRQGDL